MYNWRFELKEFLELLFATKNYGLKLFPKFKWKTVIFSVCCLENKNFPFSGSSLPFSMEISYILFSPKSLLVG